MPTVLRATDHHRVTTSVAFNFDDLTGQAKTYLDQVPAEAVKIVAKAQQEAAVVRSRARAEGRQAAMNEVEQIIQKQLATVLPALRQAILDIHQAKQAWLAQWETLAVHLAAEIAKRLIRGELDAAAANPAQFDSRGPATGRWKRRSATAAEPGRPPGPRRASEALGG